MSEQGKPNLLINQLWKDTPKLTEARKTVLAHTNEIARIQDGNDLVEYFRTFESTKWNE